MYKKMINLLDELVNENSTLMLGFTITDILFVSVMFLVYEVPVGGVIGLCSCAGGLISAIIMGKATSVAGIERGESLADKLCYFPVDRISIRKAQYRMAFKITGMQLIATLIPLVIMSFRFKWPNALAAVMSTVTSVLFIAVLNIEINLISYERK